jgi:hypothetical protein
MKRTSLAFAFFCSILPACGGDDDPGTADAGPEADGPPVINTYTALDLYPSALQMAQTLQPDLVLYRLVGQKIGPTGEVDMSTNQSYWSYTFLDLGNSKAVTVLYLMGDWVLDGPRDMNTETLRVITTEWLDSDDGINQLVAFGPPFSLPDFEDQFQRLDMTLERFAGAPDNPLYNFPGPIWRVTKINAPPGQTPDTEEWLLICPPDNLQACDIGMN